MIFFGVLAAVLGFIGFVFQFSDLQPGETLFRRIGIILFVYLFSGLMIGFLYYQKWFIAGIAGWGSVLLLIITLIEGNGESVESLTFPVFTIGLAFGGGYAGALMNREVLQRYLRHKAKS